MSNKYETFIGLEIHIHLEANTKMFCGCKAQYGDEPNTNICPVCMGYPGVLPMVNEKAMELGYKVARALNCKLSKNTFFERKNYFYPDMPKNYQISQFEEPVGVDGWMDFDTPEGTKKIRIHDVHLEEDAGKMIHAGDMSLCDYNRAGYPLLEIVTEPDIKTPEDTELFLRNFQRMVRYMGVSDGNMDEGSMKCDANISINLVGKGLGTKVELKNMNSPRFVRKGLSYEEERQADMLDQGKALTQETRLWNENRDQTEVMRTKEEAEDYRYFPEPDLPIFRPDQTFFDLVESGLVELPLTRKHRMMEEYKLSADQAEYIHDDLYLADYFEEAVKLGGDSVQLFAWLSSDVKKLLNRENLSLQDSPLTASWLTELLELISSEAISGKIAKKVLDFVFSDKKSPKTIVEEKGMSQVSDPAVLTAAVDKVMAANPDVVEAIKGGDNKQRGFLMGQLMKETGGKAAPVPLQKILAEKLG
ncbi:MAG: Asp-tRNA(Asn)/Glu-tRNA(Gln) amidotransferase subunit GatB [Spirochaetaceae bacterium]|jgi:aspartyl-tRNA(Asn)/glutamyl-tRNA(Gln) amidotransferase subunit B|nr:Asp-tRNA(Asn)/Glu-tRNA(Gln) amidotransferase subunit GatB [Spirochaetaceae bacterium]